MGVKLQSSSGGSVEIAAPVTASNYVLTAPAVTSTVDTLARTGNVLQVVNATYSTEVASSSITFADTGLTATITPTSASSKILVLISQAGPAKRFANVGLGLKLLRNGSPIQTISVYTAYTADTSYSAVSAESSNYLDSPNTTSPVVYKTQFASTAAASEVLVQFGNCTSTITLMEIAG